MLSKALPWEWQAWGSAAMIPFSGGLPEDAGRFQRLKRVRGRICIIESPLHPRAPVAQVSTAPTYRCLPHSSVILEASRHGGHLPSSSPSIPGRLNCHMGDSLFTLPSLRLQDRLLAGKRFLLSEVHTHPKVSSLTRATALTHPDLPVSILPVELGASKAQRG